MDASHKQEIITFKVDESLRHAMRGIPNRSEFIRHAILAALDSACPLCRGTGILTPHQRQGLQGFMAHHKLTECDDCHAFHLECEADDSAAELQPVPPAPVQAARLRPPRKR